MGSPDPQTTGHGLSTRCPKGSRETLTPHFGENSSGQVRSTKVFRSKDPGTRIPGGNEKQILSSFRTRIIRHDVELKLERKIYEDTGRGNVYHSGRYGISS